MLTEVDWLSRRWASSAISASQQVGKGVVGISSNVGSGRSRSELTRCWLWLLPLISREGGAFSPRLQLSS